VTPSEDEIYSEEIFPRVRETVAAVVRHEFLTLLNPRYRGDGWDWKKFERYCLRWTEIHVRNAFGEEEWSQWGKQAQRDARRLTKLEVQTFLKESGILEWWPDPTRKPEAP
jgi:hypothetical protein